MINSQSSDDRAENVRAELPAGVRRRKTDPTTYALVAGLVLLALAGVALLFAYFHTMRQTPPAMRWVNPLDAVQSKAVAPDLAVLPLAGEPDDRVVRAALDANEVETAYAVLAYATLLPDSVRSGHWALLAERYAPAATAGSGTEDARARAVLSYKAALDMASLAPGLNDVARASLSLQAARGMAGLGQDGAARLALAQAENIGRYSLTLLPAQRRDVLGQVVAGYRSLGDQKTATALQAQINDASAGPGVKTPPPADYLATLRGTVVLPPEVTAAIRDRQAAAAALAARWFEAGGSARPQLAAALGSALQAEDDARTQFYTQGASLPPGSRLAMLYDQISWWTVKYRAARGAYGTSLVPDWESRAPEIASDLTDAYTGLINTYGQQLDTLDPVDAAQGRLQLLEQGLLWVRLGLFPDHAEAALSTQLSNAARQLWTSRGGAGLVVVSQDVGGAKFYLLAGGAATGK